MASRTASWLGLTVALVIGVGGGACGGGDSSPATGGGDDAGGSGDDGGLVIGDGSMGNMLVVDPQNQTIDANGPGATLQFTAHLKGSTAPLSAQWTSDVAAIGTVGGTGLFTASGQLGGVTRISATTSGLTASTNLTVKLHLADNPGNIDGPTQMKLQAGGMADPAFKWLYPYDKTVFPRGLTAPTLMFAGAAPNAIYVHVSSNGLDYKGFFLGTNARVDVAPSVWTAITGSAGASDPVKVEVTKIAGGVVTGPISESWTIAQGSLKGTVYYNSYSSALVGGGVQNGAVLRMKPGGMAELLIGGPATTQCTVCHAVSADGSTLVASHSDYVTGASYSLASTGATPRRQQPDSTFSFGGLYPDGSLLMSNAAFMNYMPSDWAPNVPGQTQGPRPSRLYDSTSGAMIGAPGWDNVVNGAITPAFSPDGKHIAFNHFDNGSGHSLAVMDFTLATKTFSNLVELTSDPNSFLAWPAFVPDGKWLVYHSDSRADYGTWQAAKGDIFISHIASKTVARLDLLDGYANGQTYLPYGDAEAHLNYEPTMLPVAAGGYYWVVFTSRRKYGNLIVDDPQDAQDRKKLWVAAIDINTGTGENPGKMMAYDASHPAFYLPGQELAAGNMRGFWALDPCKQTGNTCVSGDECCTGYCRQSTGPDGGIVFACVTPPAGCSNEFEKCTTTADCCGASSGALCINGHCATAPK